MRVGLSKLLATMAALGISVKKISKHQTRKANATGRRRLALSRGAGSINAKADIQQLCNAGKYDEARDMAEAHERMCGEKIFPSAWWRTSISQG